MKKVLLLLALLAFFGTADAQRHGKKKNVFTKKVAVLTRHPDEISLRGSDDTTSFYFFVTDNGLFFTEIKSVFEEISNHLPSLHIPGRSVEIGGTTLKPFTKFPKRQLDYLSRRAGKAINKQTDAVRISEHSLLSGSAQQTFETVDAKGNPVREQ